MKHEIKLPKLGDTTEFVVVESWEAHEGEQIVAGQTLMTVETDKITVDVPSPVSGTLTQHLVAEGDEVVTGGAIAVVMGA